MRLVRSVLESIQGIEIYAIISIMIFFLFFIGLIIRVMLMNPKKADEYSRMPLAPDDDLPVDNKRYPN